MTTFGYLLPTRGSVLASDDPHTLAAKTRADVLDLATQAETLGFRSVWVGDSVLARPRHEPLTTLAAIAGRTDAIELGTAVYLPALRHPVNVAHQTATIDQLSGGRLRLGIGAGSGVPDVEAEFENLDADFENRGSVIDESLDIITSLWSGDSVDYSGAHFSLSDASIGFEPVGDPSLYFPTNTYDPDRGLPRRIRRRIIRHGDGCLPNAMPPATYSSSLDYLTDRLTEADRSPSGFDSAIYLDVVLADDRSTAIETARSFYDRYYAGRPTPTEDQITVRGAFGPPETVVAGIQEYIDAGAETVVIRFTTPDQGPSLRAFADAFDL